MFAITVFPKRLGLVIQICEFPVSAGKNNSSSIKLLSTKYGFLTSLSYKEYGAALFKKFPFSASSVFFIFIISVPWQAIIYKKNSLAGLRKALRCNGFVVGPNSAGSFLCSFLSYITLKRPASSVRLVKSIHLRALL